MPRARSSPAYTVASYRQFDTLARMHGEIVAFSPHVANGQTVTLNVDGLGAKPLRPRPGYELQSNALISGTPYTALYNHVDGVFYLHAFGGGDAYGIPLGGGLDYWGATTPSTSFAFPAGQAISRTTYAALFALIGTTYGAGDGSTTFNLPDKAGRVSAMKEASASRLTAAGGGVDGGTLGAAAGQQTRTLVTANFPPYTPAGGGTFVSTNGPFLRSGGVVVTANPPAGGGMDGVQPGTGNLVQASGNITFSGTPQGGTSTPLATVQPTIICNYIMRVL